MIIKDARDLHNPHYIDFMRKNPNFKYNSNEEKKAATGPQVNPCDMITLDTIQLPDAYVVMRRVEHLPDELMRVITAFQQQMGHVRWAARRKFIGANQYDEIEYALRYVTKSWDEKRWRIQIEHHDRFRQTNQEYIDVIITWLVVMNDLFTTHLPPSGKISTVEGCQFIEQMFKISDYTNKTIQEMNTMYKRITPTIELPRTIATQQLMDEFLRRKYY